VTVRATPELAMRVSRAEAVARQLESEILGGLEPGVRIGTKEDLRVRFGVAVATVNEAVRLLEMRGLIEARPGPGGGYRLPRALERQYAVQYTSRSRTRPQACAADRR